MPIFSVFIVNRAGSLIHDYDHSPPKAEIEKTFSFPLEPVLKLVDKRVVVSFGQRDGIKIGYTLLGINGLTLKGRGLVDEREGRDQTIDHGDVFEVLADEHNYPISLRFGRPKLSTNEKIMLASMFHSLFAIGGQLSPEPKSSGIEMIETDSFKLYCTQTLTGVKFIVLSDPKQTGMEALLRKLYEVYSDFALKNPFYSVDMPIRCDLFDQNLQSSIEQAEKLGTAGV